MKVALKNASAVIEFFDNVEALLTEQATATKEETAAKMLASMTILKFLDKHRRLRAFPHIDKPKKITIPEDIALAIFILAKHSPDIFFIQFRGNVDKYMLVGRRDFAGQN